MLHGKGLPKYETMKGNDFAVLTECKEMCLLRDR